MKPISGINYPSALEIEWDGLVEDASRVSDQGPNSTIIPGQSDAAVMAAAKTIAMRLTNVANETAANQLEIPYQAVRQTTRLLEFARKNKYSKTTIRGLKTIHEQACKLLGEDLSMVLLSAAQIPSCQGLAIRNSVRAVTATECANVLVNEILCHTIAGICALSTAPFGNRVQAEIDRDGNKIRAARAAWQEIRRVRAETPTARVADIERLILKELGDPDRIYQGHPERGLDIPLSVQETPIQTWVRLSDSVVGYSSIKPKRPSTSGASRDQAPQNTCDL